MMEWNGGYAPSGGCYQNYGHHSIGGSTSVVQYILPQESKLQLANSFLVGKLLYLIPLWGEATPQLHKTGTNPTQQNS